MYKNGWKVPYTFLFRDGRLSVKIDTKSFQHLFHDFMLTPFISPYQFVKDIQKPHNYVNHFTAKSCSEPA